MKYRFQRDGSRRPARARGFTILELVIVIAIISIFLGVSIPVYQRFILQGKEAVLKQDLKLMREQIDKYAGDRDESPGSLEDLVRAGYLREVPVDPITQSKDTWEVVMESEPITPNGKIGIKEVFSGAPGTGYDGKSYKEW